MCKMKGCSRPSFVGGLCGFHALQGYYQDRAAARTGTRKPRTRRAVAGQPVGSRPPPGG